MSERFAQIGGKRVQLARPYEARGLGNGALVGRETELRMVTAAWLFHDDSLPMSPLLLGEPGVGKNRLVYEIARQREQPLYIFQGHEDVTPEDLACSARFSDDAERTIDYVASPLVTALYEGGICFIDEIGKIRQRALAPLASVLDERRYIDSTLLGERIEAAAGFRLVAASNTADFDGNVLPEFLRSRLRPVIRVERPSVEDITNIVTTRFSGLGERVAHLLEIFWGTWRRVAAGRGPTPREAIQVFALASRLAEYDRSGVSPAAPCPSPSTHLGHVGGCSGALNGQAQMVTRIGAGHGPSALAAEHVEAAVVRLFQAA